MYDIRLLGAYYLETYLSNTYHKSVLGIKLVLNMPTQSKVEVFLIDKHTTVDTSQI
jgi:hypothetical protein